MKSRSASLLLTLIATARSDNLRSRTEKTDSRILSGAEEGVNRLKAIFSDIGIGNLEEEQQGLTPSTDPDFSGGRVHFSPRPQPLDSDGNSVAPRIVGGYPLSDPQENFVMHLRFDTSDSSYHFAGCGGTLISPCHVLTAAHCSANGRVGLPDGVYVNAFNPFEGNMGHDFHFSQIKEAIIHPGFDDSTNVNDVAVLVLQTCADTQKFPVMQVGDQAFLDTISESDLLSVAGFGLPFSSFTGDQTEQLQKVNVHRINSNTCNSNSYYGGRVSADMICAGEENGGKDSCQGDSGGPLFADLPGGSQKQVGIVSWGSGCADARKPGVYASTAYHYDWLKQNVCGTQPGMDENFDLCRGTTITVAAFPTESPARDRGCGELGDTCWFSSSCCAGNICRPRDGVCVDPNPGKNDKTSLYGGRRRRNGD